MMMFLLSNAIEAICFYVKIKKIVQKGLGDGAVMSDQVLTEETVWRNKDTSPGIRIFRLKRREQCTTRYTLKTENMSFCYYVLEFFLSSWDRIQGLPMYIQLDASGSVCQPGSFQIDKGLRRVPFKVKWDQPGT
ncbi:hypothetical protein NPIL_647341 [Nephila pilipes]|uniref:Uncharacterized protein n=1 Tax=Nephila pilipes TaxID=299642 RepID=A0A8X6PXF4_NEPPI|nr:hypothetical protein NPIL_647341 [Nephila pilipes]